MFAVIIALNVIGWFIIIALVAPHHYTVGTKDLRDRHRADGLHPRDEATPFSTPTTIAAIDNTTRKLMGDGKRTACRSGSGSPSGTRPSFSSSRSCCHLA